MTNELLNRRNRTIGQFSPLFYREPLELIRGEGVWLFAADGTRYLDAYNNVPHVGHAHPRVVEAVRAQAATLNIHTRYLNDRIVDYAEELLSSFSAELNRVFLVNSGSEANDLAFRIAQQHTGNRGVLISDFSYHGNTMHLARMSTGLTAAEGLADWVRPIHIPDCDTDPSSESELSARALEEVDRAIDSLRRAGHGLSAFLFDPLFSTEGLNRLPAGYLAGVVERVHAAGGLIIADEVQSGFGRVGSHMWGHQRVGVQPDLVTLGKPMGNGHPIGAVVTGTELLEEFGPRNMYFNTFGGNPVSSAAGHEVLKIMRDEGLRERAVTTGERIREHLESLVRTRDLLGPVRGSGLFFGFGIFADPEHTHPDATATARVVEAMRENGVLISRIGPHDNVLKMRPPLAFDHEHVDVFMDALGASLDGAL